MITHIYAQDYTPPPGGVKQVCDLVFPVLGQLYLKQIIGQGKIEA